MHPTTKIEALIAIAIDATMQIGDVGGWRGAGDVAISSFFLPLSLSLSLFYIFLGCISFEVKMETEMIFRCFGSHFRSTGNAFQFDRI